MGAPKYELQNNSVPPRRARPPLFRQTNSKDYAQELFWFTIGLQVLSALGFLFKIQALISTPVFYAELLTPATMFLVASTWRRAFWYALYSSLMLPALVSLVLIVAATISIAGKPSARHLAKLISMNISTSFLIWIVVLKVALPAFAVGIGTRAAWTFFRAKK